MILKKSIAIIFFTLVFFVYSCSKEINQEKTSLTQNSQIKIIDEDIPEEVEEEKISTLEEEPKANINELLNVIKKAQDQKSFEAKANQTVVSVEGITSGLMIASPKVLFVKNLTDLQNYQLNVTGDVWIAIFKRKLSNPYFFDKYEKSPYTKFFKYSKSSFDFDEMALVFLSAKPQSFNAKLEKIDQPIVNNFFGMPLDNISCCYDNRDLGAPSTKGSHLGQDLIAKSGDKVYSIADGVVKRAWSISSGYGAVIIIEHTLPDNTKVQSIYGHLSRSRGLKVKTGDLVKKGEIIGFIGDDTENGDGLPHLHLGLKLGNWDTTYPGYCGSGVNKIFSGSDYKGIACSSKAGRFVKALTFMESVNKTSKNPYSNL
ncbi:MAG: M23 family metallopeptidase [Cyanobacteriota bacterium]